MRSLVVAGLLLGAASVVAGRPVHRAVADDAPVLTPVPAWIEPTGDLPACHSGWHLGAGEAAYVPVRYAFFNSGTTTFTIRDAHGVPFVVLPPGQSIALDCFDEDDL